MRNSAFNLTGQLAVVTGGAGWLGQSMVKALAEAGAQVIIASRNISNAEHFAQEMQQLKLEVYAEQVDISRQENVLLLARTIRDKYGDVDILVNNAGGGSGASVAAMSESQWFSVMNSTLNGCFWCCQSFGSVMRENSQGAIVNISSILGIRSYTTELAEDEGYPPVNYSAAKAGIIGMTHALSAQWAQYNVRVNSLTPGAFPPPERHEGSRYLAALEKRIPMGRTGRKNELAGPLLFLCSEASSYVTGHNLIVDGGWSST